MKKTNEEILLYLTILELPTFKELDIDILKKQYTKQYKKYHPSLATQDKYKDGQNYQLLTEAYRYIKENIQYVNKVIVSNALTKVEVKDNKEIVKKSITIKKEQPKVSLEKENKKDEKINLSLKNKILIASLFISLVIGIVTLSFGLQKNIEDKKVEKVEQMIEDKQYDDAKDKIEEIDKDIAQQLLKKIEALKLLEEGHFAEAIEILKQLGTVSINYNLDGGEFDYTKEIDFGFGKYFEAIKKGYTFDKYVVDDFKLTEEGITITLKALYEAIIYKIIYELDGGENNPNNPNEYYTSQKDITIYEPTKDGYTFIGWSDKESKKEKANPYIIETGTTNNITLYANWLANQYKITFDTNGGDPIEPLDVTYGKYVPLPTPTRPGFIFTGWYRGNTRVTSKYWDMAGGCILEAKWEARRYTLKLKYYQNDTPNYYQETIKYGDSFTLPTPSKEGHTFLGFFYNDNEKVQPGLWFYLSDIEAEGRYQVNEYTITLDPDEGQLPSSNTLKVLYNSEISLPTPTKEGYKFLGWYNSYDEEFTDTILTVGYSFTLKAKWEKISFKIMLVNGINISYQTVTVGEEYTLPILTREGYTFLGWYDIDNNEYNDGIWEKHEDIRLIAIWQKNS